MAVQEEPVLHGPVTRNALIYLSPMPLAPLFLVRALRIWVLARLLVMMLALLAGASADGGALRLAPGAALALVGFSAALGLVDVARRGERALLGNFGVSRLLLLTWLVAPAAVGEVAIAMLVTVQR